MLRPSRSWFVSAALISLPWFVACGSDPAGSDGNDQGDADANTDASSGGTSSDTTDDIALGGNCNTDCGGPDVCGDGILSGLEACDDGHTEEGDGCSADCKTVSPGFICPTPGEPCRAFVSCGDGIVSFPEQCDGGPDGAAGCSDKCKIADNTKCEGSPSVCTPTTCGDGSGTGLGTPEGTEGCDLGDTIPFDGCSDACQVEPTCDSSGGGCTSVCGDGIVLNEACDDGNALDGDGCSSTCTVEAGSTCESAPCEKIGDQCIMRIPAIFRDFNASHADFQLDCAAASNMVSDQLGSDGLPVRTGTGGCASKFEEWYHHVEGVNSLPIVGEILLFDNGDGGYVNRWKDDGTQFTPLTGAPKDGQPFFFPIDDAPGAITTTVIDDTPAANGRHQATVNFQYSGQGGENDYKFESQWTTPIKYHNFHFTSQVQHWFRYDASKVATLAFTGDDDVWVFINGKRALDLGGLHNPASGSVTISAATAAGFNNLVDGNVYPISIFHAERRTDGSSFRLTLTELNLGKSECHSNCGDGIIGADEECDNTINPGGYNQCQPDCRLGGYCGDGIVQPEEDCDYRAPDVADCNTGCRFNTVK